MAHISLKDYQAKIEKLLREEQYDEAAHHCRHILQRFPRNAATYRLLGRALSGASRWQEAEQVLRSVLGVYPNDGATHRALSQVYIMTRRLDEAIWHLERAYEQDPSNEKLIENLRRLYQQARNVEVDRLPLTAGGAARQHLRGELYGQAIDVLQQALKRDPERVDLRLLLAQTFWRSQRKVEAAETALDILQVLPDCMEANRILTELWLQEERPFDAQRYLGRIEALDPYLAMELATGEQVPKDTYSLDELDYQQIAQRELISANPDWLQAFGETGTEAAEEVAAAADEFPAADALAWVESPAADAEEFPDIAFDQLPADEDWSLDEEVAEPLPADLLGELGIQSPFEDEAQAQDMFADFDAPEESPVQMTPPPRKKTGLTGLLNLLGEPESSEEPQAQESEPEDARAEVALDALFDDMDELEAAAEVEAVAPSLFDDDDQEDPMAWLREEGIELADEEPAAPARPQTGDLDDPMAWLRSSGIEIVDEEEAGPADIFGDDSDLVLQEPDPMDWLRSSGIEVDDDLASARRTSARAVDAEEAAEDEEADPLAWLKDSGIDVLDDDQGTALAGNDIQAALNDDSETSGWIADDSVLEDLLALEQLTEGGAFPEDDRASSENANLEMTEVTMFDDKNDQPENWFDPDESGFDDESELESLEWLADDQAPVASSEADDDEHFDDDDFDWMDESAAEAEAEAPDWLAAAAPVSELGESFDDDGEDEPAADFDWSEELSEEESADWLSEISPVSQAQAERFDDEIVLDEDGAEELDWGAEAASLQAVTPDWLDSAAPMPHTDPQVFDDTDYAEEVDWADEALEEETPRWLSGDPDQVEDDFERLEEEAEEQGPVNEDLSWETEAEELEPEADATPDWLSEVAPVSERDDERFDDDALLEDGDEAEYDWSAEAASLQEDTPDWLAPPGPMAQAEPEPLDEGGFGEELDWSDEAFEIEEEAPSWLSQSSAQAEPVDDVETPAGEAYAWETNWEEIEAEESAVWEAETSPASELDDERFDDESALEESEAEEERQVDSPMGETYAWETEAEELEPEADATPDWLSEVAPVSELDDERFDDDALLEESEAEEVSWADDELEAETPRWLSGDPDQVEDDFERLEEESEEQDEERFEWDEELVASEAETPDWLSAVGPVSELDDESFVDEAALKEEDEGEFDWSAEAAEIESGTPDWLSEAAPVSALEMEDEAAAEEALLDEAWDDEALEEETPGWLGAVDVPGSEEEPVEAETPDWLSAVGPIPEAEDQMALEEAIEEEPDWSAEAAEIESGTPDWLSEAAPVSALEMEDEAAAEEALLDEAWDDEALEEETPGWLGAVSEAVSEEAYDTYDTEEDFAESDELETADMPDWLASAAPAVEDETQYDDEWQDQPQAVEMPDWLSGVEPAAEAADENYEAYYDEAYLDEEPAWEEETVAADTSDWLSGLNVMEDATAELDDALLQEDEGSLDWMAETEDYETTAPASPEWLANDTLIEEEAEYEAGQAFAAELPPWLQEADAIEEEAFAAQAASQPQAEVVDEFAPLPAENAPDWLNAMVPGLDVDPEAPEDEPIEREFIESVTYRARTPETAQSEPEREFEWLSDIVEEETVRAEPAAVPAEKAGRFAFSRLPAWLRSRGKAEVGAAPATQKAAPPPRAQVTSETYSTDDDDFDLPDDWLK